MKKYLCIDLKGFYASVECALRNIDPFKVNLVVADPVRGAGAITLAITPKMKSLGVKNRSRLFEIPQNIKYIIAKPRMKLYMEYSVEIYKIYLTFFSKEDIHVYSVDEAFIDVTNYLKLYKKNEIELAKIVMEEVYKKTKIPSSAGVGTNLFLAKVALDITAKKNKTNIAYLDEEKFKEELWHHLPLTDFWKIGKATEKKLAMNKIYTMKDISKASDGLLKKLFGVDYILLKDHSLGKESCTISDIKKYKPSSSSLSSSQILFEDYNSENALIVLKEMCDGLVQKIVDEKKAVGGIAIYIGYSDYEVLSSKMSKRLENTTNKYYILINYVEKMYEKIINKDYYIRKLGITFFHLTLYKEEQLSLFEDFSFGQEENALLTSVNTLKKKYGKSSVLRAISYEEKANQKARNKLIGGHNAE